MVHNKRDDSAITPLVGILLAFAIFVSLLAVVQLSAVPVWNQSEELNHQNAVRNDLQRLSASIQTTASTGGVGSTAVEMGMTYPHRAFTRSPPSPTGTLSAGDAGAIGVENAVALGEETDDYWNGTRREFTTSRLTYEPNYNEIQGLTTVHEGNVMYHRQGDGTSLASDRKPVNGRTLRLTALGGEFSETTVAATDIETFPVSAPARRVAVTSGADPLTFELPTELPEERWDELLQPELEENGGYVADYNVDSNAGTVTVEMVPERDGDTVTYSLYMAKVGVEEGFGDTTAEYVTTPEGQGTEYTVEPNTNQSLTVEVRDSYNNPVSGVEVGFDTEGGNLSAQTAVTGENGQATVTYTTTTPMVVRASIAGREAAPEFDPQTKEDMEFRVSLTGDEGSGGTEDAEINPNYLGSLVLEDATIETCSSGSGQGQRADCRSMMEFRNTAGSSQNVESARINFYSADTGGGPPGQQRSPPSRGVLEGASLGIGDGFKPVNIEFEPGTTSIPMDFYENGDEYDMVSGDFYVLTFVFEDDTASRYFVGPVED
mgnify:FL=1